MNVGEIRLVDDSIGRLIKLTDTTAIFLCLSFPYFRSMRLSDADKCKKLSASLGDFQQLLDLPANNAWTLTAWRGELKRLTQAAIEEYEDSLEDLDDDGETSFARMDLLLKKIIKQQIDESDWLTDPVGQEKVIQYSINYLDVTPDLIYKFVKDTDRHRWQSIKKASATAHLMIDVYQSAKLKLKNSLSDY
jgi:hypothetical protein